MRSTWRRAWEARDKAWYCIRGDRPTSPTTTTAALPTLFAEEEATISEERIEKAGKRSARRRATAAKTSPQLIQRKDCTRRLTADELLTSTGRSEDLRSALSHSFIFGNSVT